MNHRAARWRPALRAGLVLGAVAILLWIMVATALRAGGLETGPDSPPALETGPAHTTMHAAGVRPPPWTLGGRNDGSQAACTASIVIATGTGAATTPAATPEPAVVALVAPVPSRTA